MGWRWKAGFLASLAAFAAAIAAAVSAMSRRSDEAVASRSLLERIEASSADLPVDSLGRFLTRVHDSLSPSDLLLARLRLAMASMDTTDIFRLSDSVEALRLAPAESLSSWRMLPRLEELSRRMSGLDTSKLGLEGIAAASEACLRQDSTLLACHLAYGSAALLDGNWRELEIRSSRALAIHPGDFRLQGFRGIGFLRRGDLSAARNWIPDVRARIRSEQAYASLLEWTSRIFLPWREAALASASDSLLARLPLSDTVREAIASLRRKANPRAPREGFLSCDLAANTFDAIYLCRPLSDASPYPQLGSDTSALRKAAH